MNRLQLATLLSWAGDNGLHGRKRLQKVVYFLQEAGCPLNCRYTLHHFGPYSWDVADACDEMFAAGLVKETARPFNGETQYAYALEPATHKLLQQTRDEQMQGFESLGRELINEHIWTLELGSTILFFFRQGGNWQNALTNACEYKKVPSNVRFSQAALALAKRFEAQAGSQKLGDGVSDKVFRDPLYNYIAFDRQRDGWLIELANSPEVQRLRRIHQLGVSNFTYPGADHTRFAHSLGVTNLMQLVLDHLTRACPAAKIEGAQQALLATALLHDVGHGPFSHLFEPCLGINHEKWSIAVVTDESTQVHKALKRQDAYLPDHVADLIDSKNVKHPAWQRALMSSQLDVDRLDYLRRDSLFTGAGYGHFDWHRLLTTMEFHDAETDLVWPAKSALAIEEYIFARYYMYQNVYFHKTTRGFERLLQAMWRRANQLRQSGTDVNANPVLERFWKIEKPEPGKMPVTDYLAVEEFTVLEQIQRWTGHSDKALADCARRFLNRDGLAKVDPPPPVNPLKADDFGEWEPELHKLLRSKGYDEPAMYCLSDKLDEKYLRPYFEEKEPKNQNAVNTIRIMVDGTLQTIGQHLPRLAAVIAKAEDRTVYYVPKEIRGEAKELSKRLRESKTGA